jgi:hypothetical protein
MAAPQLGRIGQLYRRLHNLKSGFDPDLQETIQPVHELNNPLGPDLHRLRGEELVMARGSQAAVAAQNSQVYAQAGPGYVWVIEEMWVNVPANAGNIQCKVQVAQAFPPPGANFAINVDGRAVPQTVAVGAETAAQNRNVAMGAGSGAAFGDPGIFMDVTIPANTTQLFRCRIVLFGNTRLQWNHGTVNQALAVTCVGWARQLEPSEVF